MPKKTTPAPTKPEVPESTEQTVKSIYMAFLELKKAISKIEFIKNTTGSTGAREYKYQDLPDIHDKVDPLLSEYSFIWQTRPSVLDGQPSLKYALIYAPTGEAMEGEMLLMSANANPQDQGSAITYARRYSLTNILDIVADEDDDASKAARVEKEAVETLKKPAHINKKSNIFVMLREVKLDPDEYIKTLKGAGVDWDQLTNEQADDILQKLGAYINHQRAATAAERTTVPAEIAPQ